MLQALNKNCSAGPHAGPVASEGHRLPCGQWASAAEPGQMPIQKLWEAGCGPQRATQRSHSLTFLPAAFQPHHSLNPGGPANQWRRVHRESQLREERRAWSAGLPRSPDPSPWSEGQMVYRAHFRKPHFSLGSWRKLPATRQEGNVKKGEEEHPTENNISEAWRGPHGAARRIK